MRVRRNALALLAVALVSAACGGSSAGSVASAPKDDGAASTGGSTVEMATTNYAFSPAELHGTPGQKVTIHLTNSSGTEHNFTLADQKVDKDIESGDDADVTVTFPASGQLVFICEYHAASKGMRGTLVTGSGAASPLPSTSTSSDDSDSGGGGYTY